MASQLGEQCTALNLSDERRCQELAVSVNGLFCSFHSKQVQGLYRGYKRRNADLDKLSACPPQFLADSKIPLANQLFADIESEVVCQEVHDHLFRKFQLLERVIRARKLHHIHFFSMTCDYGHAKYLDQLQNERSVVNRALERIERRTAEILYKKQRWFKWVRQCQDEEEAHRDKEQKRVKQEAALFRRHWKDVQKRIKELRAREEQKIQDALLEKVYKERLAEEEEDDEDGSDWDPIDDVLEDQRGKFIDLIKHFLWMVGPEDVADRKSEPVATDHGQTNGERGVVDEEKMSDRNNTDDTPSNRINATIPETLDEAGEWEMRNSDEDKKIVSSKKSKASKKKKNKIPSESQKQDSQTPLTSSSKREITSKGDENLTLSKTSKNSKGKKKFGEQPASQEPDKSLIETREEMYERLKNGSQYNLDEVVGVMVAGTMENPVVATKTITYREDEIELLLSEVSEIKHLLLCRLLLGHAALLPAALRAESVEAFLSDPEITESNLRDLCLKMERPGLQEIRDACADLFRSEDDEANDEANDEEKNNDEAVAGDKDETENDTSQTYDDMMVLKPEKPKGALPDTWLSKREKARNKMPHMPTREDILGGGEGTLVDFGEIKDGKFQKRMIRVKVCGRTIWNYPSYNAMTRKGWLHFCILAKDSSLYDAIALCRHWDEFFDLNILSVWHYFPGANWVNWVGNRWRQQMLQLGFIMYFESSEPDAMDLTRRHQTARNGPFKRSYSIFEARNFICAHIKRDDPVSRRFIQYLNMRSNQLLMLVRDAETGRILVKPPEEERWLIRQKSGMGRAAKGEWNVIKKVGPQFFEEMDTYRRWNFGFKEYYDIILWDLPVGESFPALYNAVQETLFKAHRFCTGADLYNPGAHILRTITRDNETQRVRDLKPEVDSAPSIYDDIHHEGTSFFYGKLETLDSHVVERDPDQSKIPKRLFYTEADALEDEILFPEEHSDGAQVLEVEKLRRWEEEGFSLTKFVEGWWTDSDEDTSEEENEDEDDFTDSEEDGDSDEIGDSEDAKDNEKIVAKQGDRSTDSGKGSLGPLEALPGSLEELMSKLIPNFELREEREPDMEEEFMEFLDREKARVFKEVWHKADLEPFAQSRYIEMKEMARKSRKFNQRDLKNPMCLLTFELVHWLDAFDADARDLHKAVGKLAPFFNPDFLESKEGEGFKESLLFKQQERANDLPDIRSSVGNARRSKAFWKEWDEVQKDMQDLDDTPAQWDLAIRPIIAHLYKSGVIRNRAEAGFAGQAIAAKEPHRDSLDLFIDWRITISSITMPSAMQDPFSIPPFLSTARNFSDKNPEARFAILRLWSAPHFYPLMIGFDNRDGTSFRDLAGRTFVWMFVPKDMPNSEWSMHHAARQRIQPYTKLFRDKVVVKRNAFLVMGKDEEELKKLAMATTYAIQRKPWRWEVDLWKSFVNVDLAFLEGLKSEWLD